MSILTDIATSASGLNLWALAAKALAVLLIAGALVFGGYKWGAHSCVAAIAAQTTVAVQAQHAQDAKQHTVAAATSQTAANAAAVKKVATTTIIKEIHDKPTIITQKLDCPADPAIDQSVLDLYNKAGK